MSRTLAIGGPVNGQLVEWPRDRGYYAVMERYDSPLAHEHVDPNTMGPNFTTIYYKLQRLVLFGYECPIWVCEREDLNDPNTIDKLLMELLSFKGANVINAGTRKS